MAICSTTPSTNTLGGRVWRWVVKLTANGDLYIRIHVNNKRYIRHRRGYCRLSTVKFEHFTYQNAILYSALPHVNTAESSQAEVPNKISNHLHRPLKLSPKRVAVVASATHSISRIPSEPVGSFSSRNGKHGDPHPDPPAAGSQTQAWTKLSMSLHLPRPQERRRAGELQRVQPCRQQV